MKHFFLLLLVVGCSWLSGNAQRVSYVKAESLGDSVKLQYELQDTTSGRTYRAEIYAITDDGEVLLKQLKGSIGRITTGKHEVMWYAYRELGRYRGNISFEVRVMPEFYVFAPKKGAVYRREKPVTIRWYGGNSDQLDLTLDLYQYDLRLDSIASISRTSAYTWKIPTSLKPGDGYRIHVSGGGISAYSAEFSVKARYPGYYKLIPTALTAGGLVALFTVLGPLPRPTDPLVK